ncbi:MAG: hypothetical protein U9N59_06500 [Campylobacterota bacterium]|nr:hypothetical protein [Campylobacterota bacterium]
MSNSISFNPYQQFHGLFIPNFLLRRRELSSDAKLLYTQMVLMMAENKELHVSFDFISDEIGISQHLLKSAYEELEKYKLIETTTYSSGEKSCKFIFSDMLYGSQKVARATQKVSKAIDDIGDIESFLNPGFERLFSTYRLKNREYCGNRRDAYKAFLRLGDTFDSAVLLESAKNYLDDPAVQMKYGLYNFINDRIFLNYLPPKFIYISDDGEEIYGVYDKNTNLLCKDGGDIIGELSPERMIELLQCGRLSVRL